MSAVTPPPGSRLLSATELASILAAGGHPDAGTEPADVDPTSLGAALIALVEAGQVAAVQLPDGRLAFARTDQTPDPTAPAHNPN